MLDSESNTVSRKEKIEAILDVAQFDPKFTILIIGLGLVAAVLEGVGLSFILPIVETVQTQNPASEANDFLTAFLTVYRILGIPFTLGSIIIGVTIVMIARYSTTFVVAWFRAALRTYYVRNLQIRAFRGALYARISYFDEQGSDDVLNAIITQTTYASRAIERLVGLTEKLFLFLAYFIVAALIAPLLTTFTLVTLGALTILLRNIVEPGYDLGESVAEANEQRQIAVQAGTQGIRDTRIFGMADELYDDFMRAINKFTNSQIKLRRNEAAIDKFYNLGVAVFVFVLIYLALTLADLSIGSLGVFLFAMFQLGPKASQLNSTIYNLENDLPHLVRTQKFIQEVNSQKEPNEPVCDTPASVDKIEFDEVRFSYNNKDRVLHGVNFEVEKGEFIAFVGSSGAGKSTIVSLLCRLYQPNGGEIRANGTPIDKMDSTEWRSRLSVVRQNPYIFNNTLQYNLTIGNRDATESELDRACEVSRVDEFLDDLPNGYDTMLGDDGVRLSGGQKQRVALARAILEDTDLLILDEATSDLDSNLEKEVQAGIEAMNRDYAIIAIAHRLSTVQNANRIYTMYDGEITEIGTHTELINSGGRYEELYRIQS